MFPFLIRRWMGPLGIKFSIRYGEKKGQISWVRDRLLMQAIYLRFPSE